MDIAEQRDSLEGTSRAAAGAAPTRSLNSCSGKRSSPAAFFKVSTADSRAASATPSATRSDGLLRRFEHGAQRPCRAFTLSPKVQFFEPSQLSDQVIRPFRSPP